MMPASKREVTLELELLAENLPIITKVTEQAALVFGMQAKDAMAFTLASEEVFSYLCTNTNSNDTVRMICKNGLYYIQLDFILSRSNLDLKALNLGTYIDLDMTVSLKKWDF